MGDGKDEAYSSSSTWESLRLKQDQVPWVEMVWFPHCIPRHSFHVWLIMKKKLKTQDKMQQWDTSGSTNFNLMCCSLCKHGPDSHEHLFFECDYAMQVWNLVKPLAAMERVSNRWDDIKRYLLFLTNKKSAKYVIGKLLVAATAYFIWQERNNRLFSPVRRPATQLRDIIVSTVRLKLVTMKFRRKTSGMSILEDWKIPKS
uniref:uncharacterized protein LOC122610327 n=1 Tax=Erigeron canadensis TaxID=72917 RepID=UPI001CB8E6BE|nr:uncharacterized protein LOC122610327 [Erigeron canadensis]